eukprot:6181744-Pleurochrysis_carterae.AAC.6
MLSCMLLGGASGHMQASLSRAQSAFRRQFASNQSLSRHLRLIQIAEQSDRFPRQRISSCPKAQWSKPAAQRAHRRPRVPLSLWHRPPCLLRIPERRRALSTCFPAA